MSTQLDELYFDWLYRQVCSVRTKNPARTYKNLLHILYTKEFVWIVPNDDNRVEDGKDLRYLFLDEGVRTYPQDRLWLELPCSMLECLVALSQRAAFESEQSESEWFWEMLENIGLHTLNDRSDILENEVNEVLDRVIWRTYEYNGGGGLFPLVYPEHDQRKVELWYQLSAYILERS